MCDEESKNFGFSTCVCLTKQSFIDALKQHKPQLLIVDTYGNVDTESRTEYLMMGDEKVYTSELLRQEFIFHWYSSEHVILH